MSSPGPKPTRAAGQTVSNSTHDIRSTLKERRIPCCALTEPRCRATAKSREREVHPERQKQNETGRHDFRLLASFCFCL